MLFTDDYVLSDQVEAVMNDFIQLKPQSNVFDAETMVEGSGYMCIYLFF